MSHPLEQRISALRGRVRRLVTLYGVSWITAAVLAVVIVLGFADYLVRFQDRGLRVICSLLVLGAVAWTGYRYLYLVLIARLHDVDLALRLERRFPDLKGRLISTVEFLRQVEDDPTAGSATLRRAVIAQTTAESERLDFSDVLDRRPPLRAAMAGASICLIATILLVLDPLSSRIAVARLVNPFGDVGWPQKTHLTVREPVVTRVARGQTFEVEVIDAQEAKLPAEVHIHYRVVDLDANVTEMSELMLPRGNAMVARRENVVRPFSYRAEGGDDHSMEWIPVEVLEAPEIESLSITLIPPAYTGWPAEKAERHFRALVGTQVKIAGRTTKPLQLAELYMDGDPVASGRVDADGYRFTLPAPDESPWVVERSGSYRFELIDRDGLSNRTEDRWEIQAVPDAPPTVSIERPSGNLFVTSGAVVPLRVSAKDDLAIREIALRFSPAAESPQDDTEPDESIQPLYTGPEKIAPQPHGGLSRGAAPGDSRQIAYRWDLAELELAAGTQLEFHATAADYLPQTGRSQPRRLIVITAEELQSRLAGRQSLIRAELARVLKMQRSSRSQVDSLQIRLREKGHVERLDVDHLQAAELNQRQVTRQLTSRDEGVPMHILALLADLENNRVDSPDVTRRMQALLAEIDRLDREHLAVIGRELTAAIKTARVSLQTTPQPPASDASLAAPIAEAASHQDRVIESLQRMLDQLAQWDDYRRFYREISQLLRDQQDLGHRTTELGQRTLTKELKDLPPQDRADLTILARGQLELARQLDRIQQEMERTGGKLQETDPLAAEIVIEALHEARRRATGGGMHSFADHLQANRIGRALGHQTQIVEGLQAILDILTNRREHELTRLRRQLHQAEADLSRLEQQQADIENRLKENAQQPDEARRRRELQQLGRRQEQLRQETDRMSRRLERLLAAQPARTARQAAQQMGQAGQCAAANNCSGACQHAGEARKTLQEARRQLVQRRRQAQAELAKEQLVKLEDVLKALRGQQDNLLAETRQFDLQRDPTGRLAAEQTAELSDLAQRQRALQTATVELTEQLVDAVTFHLVLRQAADEMHQAADLLDQQQTGVPTWEAEDNALTHLNLLLEALQPEIARRQADAGKDGDQANGEGRRGKPGSGISILAELKLLKLHQQEINIRTEQLHEAVRAAENMTEVHRRKYRALSEQQSRLAELMQQLLEAESQPPEDRPPDQEELQPPPPPEPSP